MEPFKNTTMSYKKIFWGIILITIGILIMLKNLNLIWFSWQSLWVTLACFYSSFGEYLSYPLKIISS